MVFIDSTKLVMWFLFCGTLWNGPKIWWLEDLWAETLCFVFIIQQCDCVGFINIVCIYYVLYLHVTLLCWTALLILFTQLKCSLDWTKLSTNTYLFKKDCKLLYQEMEEDTYLLLTHKNILQKTKMIINKPKWASAIPECSHVGCTISRDWILGELQVILINLSTINYFFGYNLRGKK